MHSYGKFFAPVASVMLSVCGLLPLGACAGPAVPPAASKSPSGDAMTPAPRKPNGSGMAVSYRVEGQVVGGAVTAVTLEFAEVIASGARVRFGIDGGLRIVSGGEERSLPVGVSQLIVGVVPPPSGTGYLHVFTTQGGATSVTSVPFRVSGASAAPAAAETLKTTPSGEKIISIPVK